MTNQKAMTKGELMEELLRKYFLNLGYFVVRGVKYRYEDNDITDVDLYLYGRASSLTRERINVDIKNKKTPQSFERILWANGLRNLLEFDSCIVATTDRRPVIQKFGQIHKTIVLDGSFLAKIRSGTHTNRLTEEEIINKLSNHKSYKRFKNKDWRYIYESSKSTLLTEQDFAGFNKELVYLGYFIEKIMTDEQKREDAMRMVYIIISHLLIIIDYIIKDIAFLDNTQREKKLSDGLKFGNLGKEGVDKIVSMAVQISGVKSASSVMKSLENIPSDILKDFFSKNENAKNLFVWAKDFEEIGFTRELIIPDSIQISLKGVITLFLDFFGVERKKFFNFFSKSTQMSIPLEENNTD